MVIRTRIKMVIRTEILAMETDDGGGEIRRPLEGWGLPNRINYQTRQVGPHRVAVVAHPEGAGKGDQGGSEIKKGAPRHFKGSLSPNCSLLETVRVTRKVSSMKNEHLVFRLSF